nr:hypothetical protein [Succinivibrionaceae bacterium]
MPDKKQLSEEDIKLRYITPAITKKWKPENIRMEAQITAGRINLNGTVVSYLYTKLIPNLRALNSDQQYTNFGIYGGISLTIFNIPIAFATAMA